jgi:aspartyl-tRNA(Asn)/glutamyl-tRNA(Gln) amidotransferase subunit A
LINQTKHDGFGREVKLRILIGTCALSKGFQSQLYVKALKLRQQLKEKILALFEHYDFICLPTASTVAPKIGEKTTALEEYLTDIYTILGSLCGLCSLSVPLKNTDLPRGLQIMGKPGDDDKLLAFVKNLEKEGFFVCQEPEIYRNALL